MSLKNKLIIIIAVVLIILVNMVTVLRIMDYKKSESETDTFTFGEPDAVILHVIDQAKELTNENEHYTRVLYQTEKMFESVQHFVLVEETELDTQAETMVELRYDVPKRVILPLKSGELKVKPSAVKLLLSGDDRGRLVVEASDEIYVLEKIEYSTDFYKYVCELVLGVPSNNGYWD